MEHVPNFFKQLSENYYLDFLIDPIEKDFQYEDYYLLVQYQNKYYYELSLELIKKKQDEIITNLKVLFKNSISEILIEIASKDAEKTNILLNSLIEVVRVNLKTIVDDFCIDESKSRYYSNLIDNFETCEIINKRYDEKYFTYLRTFDYEMLSVIKRVLLKDDKYYEENESSLYFLQDHINRHKLLSLIPFKLFHIGQKFITELERIKKLNIGENQSKELANPSKKSSMKNTYFEKFCEILDNSTILKKSTAIGVMVDLKYCINEIKSETLSELQNKGESKNDYLDYLINEIEKQDYVKNADISYIQKYLEQYNITISEIMNMNFMKNPIVTKIDRHYNDMTPYSTEKDEAFIIQTDFLNYFCKYYADELISFLNSKKSNITNNLEQTIITPMQTNNKPFKDEYLKVFCEEISNERQVKETCFDILYESIIHYVPYLETEIKENILILDSNKKDDYLEYAIDVISKTPFAKKGSYNIDKWLEKYNVSIEEFPKFSNTELNDWLSEYYNSTKHFDLKERDFILDIQIDFYCYTSMIEANKMIAFLESKKNNKTTLTPSQNNDDVEENAKQLTVNQAIILLDKLGVFSDKTLENLPNTKKAELLGLLLGRNVKNIKTSIEKLELKPSEIKPNHQRDIDKIERLLNNME